MTERALRLGQEIQGLKFRLLTPYWNKTVYSRRDVLWQLFPFPCRMQEWSLWEPGWAPGGKIDKTVVGGINDRWHETTKYATKEGGEKGQKDIGRDLVTTRCLKKGHQNVIALESRNLDDFCLLNFSTFLKSFTRSRGFCNGKKNQTWYALLKKIITCLPFLFADVQYRIWAWRNSENTLVQFSSPLSIVINHHIFLLTIYKALCQKQSCIRKKKRGWGFISTSPWKNSPKGKTIIGVKIC